MISQESKKEMLKNFAEGGPAKHLTNDLACEEAPVFIGSLIDESSMHPGMNDPPEKVKAVIALSDYIYLKRLEIAIRKNSNADNEKDGV